MPPCQRLKGPRGGAGGQAHSRGAAHQSCVGPVLGSSSSPTPHVFPPAAPLPSPPGGSCPPLPPAFLGAETVGAATWRLPVSLATGPPSSRGACAASRKRGSWGWGRTAAPGGPESTRGRPRWLPWEREGMQLGRESSDGGCLGRGTLILSVFTPRGSAVSYKEIREWERKKIQLNKILKAVHGKKKRYRSS